VGQRPRELQPNASAAALFGCELRRCRERRGLSLARLCDRYKQAGRLVHAGYLANVEQGERLPEDRRFAEIADGVLETDGLLLRLWDFADTNRWQARDAAKRERRALVDLAAGTLAPILSGDIVFLPYVTVAGTVAYMRMTRRAFLATGGLAATALTGALDPDELARLAQALGEPRRSDPGVAEYFRRMLDLHKDGDFIIEPATRIGPVTHQIGVLDSLSKNASRQVRPLLRSAQADYAEYAGWLHQQIGNTKTAAAWTEKAMVWAQVGGHRQMVTFATVRQSNIARWSGRSDEAAELAASARTASERLPPGLASLAAQYEASAHAALGDHRACMTALGQAAEMLAARAASGEDEIYWARVHDTDHYEAQRANCFIDLGRVDEAIALLESNLAAPSATGRGAGAHGHGGGLTMLALAYAKNRRPEEACRVGEQALSFTLTAPLRATLQRLESELADWADEPSVRQFRNRLAEACPALEHPPAE
jgi:transcriptional regulator with XRE-family HTH domain